MPKFTEQEANDAYAEIPDNGIKKTVVDENTGEGWRCVCFSFDERGYELHIPHTELEMNATSQQTKDYIISFLQENEEKRPALSTYSESIEAKA